MKNVLFYSRIVIPSLVMGLLSTSCDNDSDYSFPSDIAGLYKGTAEIRYIENLEEETPAPDNSIQARVDARTISLEDFPIGDLVELIMGEEQAGAIIEAIGPVDYSIGYEAVPADDLLSLALHPQPLTITLPAAMTDEEPTGPQVVITIEAPESGTYDPATKRLVFDLGISSVELDGTPLDILPPSLTIGFSLLKTDSGN